MKHRWLIIGAGGMVGSDLVRAFEGSGDEVVAPARADLDITDVSAVERVVSQIRPTVILNCGAYTRVDDAEKDEATATRINGRAVEHLSASANRCGALLTHVSTDFVFDGRKGLPYEPEDSTAPLSAYGRSKLAGERAAATAEKHLIVRTAWLFGVNGNNFVEAIRRQIESGEQTLRVVDDQRGRPTYTPHLAAALVRLSRLAIESHDVHGIFHYADAPEASWFEFARAIVETMRERGMLAREVTVSPVTSAEFPRPAERPAYSVLSTARYESVTGAPPGSWRKGLEEYLAMRPDVE